MYNCCFNDLKLTYKQLISNTTGYTCIRLEKLHVIFCDNAWTLACTMVASETCLAMPAPVSSHSVPLTIKPCLCVLSCCSCSTYILVCFPVYRYSSVFVLLKRFRFNSCASTKSYFPIQRVRKHDMMYRANIKNRINQENLYCIRR